jgi:predicted NBD/HSP70 family sugar kinase
MQILGIDVGGTYIKTYNGKEYRKFKTPKDRSSLIKQLLEIIDNEEPQRVGLAIAGLINQNSGEITRSPNLPFLDGVNLKEELQKAYNSEIFLINDVNAATLGEYKLGAGKASKFLIGIFIGTGLGGGAVLNGKPLLGSSGCAMEIGHIAVETTGGWPCHCGRKGCLEAYVSSYGLERFYLLEGGKCKSSKEILESAKKGEEEALRAIERVAFYLAVGLTNLLHIFNPDKVVIGGGVATHCPTLVKMAETFTKQRAFKQPLNDVTFSLAQLGDYSGAVGTYYLAKEKLL